MIEFLSDTNWIAPQIDFLLFLQNLRLCHFNMFDNFFLSITVVGEFWLPMIVCAIVYWCIDFKSGVYMFSLISFDMFAAHLFKMIACVYRPWVISDKVHPVEKAIALAAGYSFPSGHSAQASALFGGLAFLLRKKIIIAVLLVLLVFVVGFSRMWLGVHTPQDVFVGLLIGFSLVFIVNSILNWAEKDKNRYLYLLAVADAAIILALLYICYFKIYPLDYVDGKLLVNPTHSKQVTIFCYGFLSGLLNGVFLCRRFFPFSLEGVNFKTKILRAVAGSVFILLFFKFGIKYLFFNYCDFKIVFCSALTSGLFITAIYPLIFTKFKAYY